MLVRRRVIQLSLSMLTVFRPMNPRYGQICKLSNVRDFVCTGYANAQRARYCYLFVCGRHGAIDRSGDAMAVLCPLTVTATDRRTDGRTAVFI